MSRSRILSSIAAASLGIALLGACSTEALTERAVGFGLERAIEGSEDIDLDFGSDGSGGFSISTDEGDFSLNFDEDNGGIVFDTDEGQGSISFDEDNGGIVYDTDEGQGSISFDEDGIVYDTDEGQGTIDFNQEDGSISFDTDEGDGVINFDDDTGAVSFESGDGSSAVFGATEVPAEWPSAIGVPQTAVPDETFFSVLNLGEDTVVSAVFQHSPDEPFADLAQSVFEAQGFTVQVDSNDANGRWAQLQNDGSSVMINSDSTGFTAITINLVGAE